MQTLWPDLRFGARLLIKSPGFTAVAVLSLGLGIGANTAIFSMINSVLIKALPYPQAEQLVRVWETLPGGGRGSVSAGAFQDWRAHSSKLAHVALYKDVRLNLTGSGTPEHVTGLQVTTEFLSVLGVTPMLGRGFVAGEDAQGGNNRVLILAHQFWQRTRELSIRLALGAQRRQIMRLVLASGMRPAIIGIVVGWAAAFALSRLVETLLFEINTHDPLVFIASMCLLGIVAALSIYLPARRAARLDPIVALRSE